MWEPILDIFSHHIFIWGTEPVFHSDCRGWKHTLSFSSDIFFPVIAIVCLFLAGAAASQCGLFSQRVLT